MSPPEIFQRQISTLLKGYAGTVVVMNDILVFGKEKAEHDHNRKAVLQTIRHSGLKLIQDNSKIGKSKIKC